MQCKEFHRSFSSPDIVRMIGSMRIAWARHVALTVEMRNAHGI
jgi:hypothetical protein